MKITRLISENIKRLVAVEIEATGDRNIIEISGKGGQGKSSVLDSIYWALVDARQHQPQPIRNGENEARIILEMGDLIVKRVFKRDAKGDNITTRLTVKNADGATYSRPVEMLEGLISGLAFDPLAFARSKPQEQYLILRNFVTGVDWDKEEEEAKTEYELRRDCNREIKTLEAQIGSPIEEGKALSEIDPEPIRERINSFGAVHKTNAVNAQQRQQQEQQVANKHAFNRHDQVRIDQLTADIERLTRVIGKLKSDMEVRTETVTRLQADIAAIPAPLPVPNMESAQQELESRLAHNRRVGLIALARTKQAQAEELTRTLTERDDRLRKAVEDADMPISGIELRDGAVYLNGAPLEQAARSQQYMLSGAITVRLNPKLRVALVRDSSVLDQDGRDFYEQLAKEHDFQFWMERTDSTGEIGFYIEDGRIAAHDGVPVLPDGSIEKEQLATPGYQERGIMPEDKLEALGVDPATNESARMMLDSGSTEPMTDEELKEIGQVDETDDDPGESTGRQQGLTL